MDQISREDIKFLDDFFGDELTEERLIELDKKLQNPNFKAYYNSRLDEKYNNNSFSKLLASYLPMILFMLLIVIGIYLIIKDI